MKYRKKPVVIEAKQFQRAADAAPIAEWCGGEVILAETGRQVAFIAIDTPEGTMRADLGDWIIRGVQGEFYPCKPDIFEQTYEVVDA